MRFLFSASVALGLAFVAPLLAAETAPRTVSDYANAMEGSAARLDALVSAREKAGDMAAAQRLVLAAAMARQASGEFRGAEQAMLTEDVSRLPAPVPERAGAAVAEAAEAERRAADDPAFVAEALAKFNALLAALPIAQPHPVFYGVLSRDLAASLPSDLVIYGYRLVDPALKLPPVVFFRATAIASLAVKDDRIDVTLPAEIRQAVDFAPPPCQSRSGFGLRVIGFYAQPRGLWPLSWNNEVKSSADLFVLPSPIFYTAKILAGVEAATRTMTTVPFDARSELVVADCGETRTAEVDVALPQGFRDLTCASRWSDASGAAKAAGRCAAEGGRLRVTGELGGGAKICSPDKLCTCPNSAQGYLVAKGSYQIETAGETLTSQTEAQPLTFPAGALAEGEVAVGGDGRLRHLTLSVSRRGCPTAVDTLGLNIGDDPREKAEAVSKTGAFRAIFQHGSLTVGALDAYPTAIDKTP